jgi:hypothetical protein
VILTLPALAVRVRGLMEMGSRHYFGGEAEGRPLRIRIRTPKVYIVIYEFLLW